MLSLLIIDIAAVLNPFIVGLNATVKVVLPPAATVALGAAVTAKSAAFVPEKLIATLLKFADPVFLRVKTFLLSTPK